MFEGNVLLKVNVSPMQGMPLMVKSMVAISLFDFLQLLTELQKAAAIISNKHFGYKFLTP